MLWNPFAESSYVELSSGWYVDASSDRGITFGAMTSPVTERPVVRSMLVDVQVQRTTPSVWMQISGVPFFVGDSLDPPIWVALTASIGKIHETAGRCPRARKNSSGKTDGALDSLMYSNSLKRGTAELP